MLQPLNVLYLSLWILEQFWLNKMTIEFWGYCAAETCIPPKLEQAFLAAGGDGSPVLEPGHQ